MKHRAIAQAVFPLLLLCAAASAIDVPLTYDASDDSDEAIYPFGGHRLTVSPVEPAGDWRFPGLVGKPLFGIVKLGGEERLVVLSQLRTWDPFFNRLLFDANANHDLTDDPALEADHIHHMRGEMRTLFPPVDTTIRVGDTSMNYRFRMQVLCEGYFDIDRQSGNVLDNLMVSQITACRYTGSFEADGQTYHLVLGDRNGNGRFDDTLAAANGPSDRPGQPLNWSGDVLYLGAKGCRLMNRDELRLSDRLVLRDKVYAVEVAPDCSRMTLTPERGVLPSLTLPPSVERLQILAQDGSSVLLYRPTSPARVPPGAYTLASYQLLRYTDNHDVWRLDAVATAGCALISVAQNSMVAPALGEPFRPTVEWGPGQQGTGTVRLYLKLRGAANELVTDLIRVSGSSFAVPMSGAAAGRPREATFRVATPGGEVVHSGRFEYG